MPFVNTDAEYMRVMTGKSYIEPPAPEVDRLSQKAVGGQEYINDDASIAEQSLTAPESSFWDGFNSMFRTENEVADLIRSSGVGDYEGEYDPTFEPLAQENIKGYEGYSNILGHARNRKHFDAMLEDLKQQEIDRFVIDKSGTFTQLAGGVAAGVASPLSLLGGTVGYKVLKGTGTALRTTGTGVAAVVAPETFLQANQELRTDTEGAYNVMAGAALSAVLGGSAHLFRNKNAAVYSNIVNDVKAELKAQKVDTIDILRKENMDVDRLRGVGADAVADDINKGKIAREGLEQIIRGETIKGAAKIESLVSGLTPLLRGLNSPFLRTRTTMQMLLNNPLVMQKNAGGVATEQSVAKLSELYQTDYFLTAQKTKDVFNKYRKESKGEKLPLSRRTLKNKITEKIGGKIPESSFNEEIGKALRRNGEHKDPYIKEAAKQWRKFFDDMGDAAVKAGIWKELPDRKVAESYFTRVFDKDAILEDRQGFLDEVRNWVSEQTVKKVGAIESKYNRLIKNAQAQIDDLDINTFRKASYIQDKAEVESGLSGLSIEDIKDSLEILGQGMPKKPETLLEFISRKGGIDINDELFNNITSKELKLWEKANRKRVMNTSDQGAKYIDDLGELLWEEGFFPSYSARPEADEVVEAILDEIQIDSPKVRDIDADAYNDWVYMKDLQNLSNQLGLRPRDYKNILPDAQKQLREAYIKASEVRAKQQKVKLEQKIGRLQSKLDDELRDIRELGVETYSEDIADNITDTILGLDEINPEFKFNIAERGPLKSLKFLIPDHRIERFLNNDINDVAERYARTAGVDIELMNKFGSTKFEDIIAPVRLERKEALNNAKTPEARKAIKKLAEKEDEDLQAAYDLVRGTYDFGTNPDSVWSRVGNAALTFNYIRMLGGVTLSSIPDVGKLVGFDGIGAFYKDAMKPLAKRLAGMNKELLQISKEDLALAGAGIEHIRNSRALSLADISSRYSNRTVFENMLDTTSKIFSRATGITDWNNMMHKFAGLMSQNRILRNLEGKLDKKETQYMAGLGLDSRMIKDINEQFLKYGKKDGDFRVANLDQWDNLKAKKAYRAALQKDIESVVIRKDIGDIPSFGNSPIGKMILQFKSFMFASMTKTLLPYIQRGDAAVIQGFTSMVALGAMTYVIKENLAGREPSFEPEKLFVEGVDRSGFLSIFMEANNIWEKMGGYGANRAVGGEMPSRYFSRSVAESIFGPSLGTVGNLAEAVYTANKEGALSDSDKKNIRRLMPFNNLWAINMIMNQADEQTRKSLGY